MGGGGGWFAGGGALILSTNSQIQKALEKLGIVVFVHETPARGTHCHQEWVPSLCPQAVRSLPWSSDSVILTSVVEREERASVVDIIIIHNTCTSSCPSFIHVSVEPSVGRDVGTVDT